MTDIRRITDPADVHAAEGLFDDDCQRRGIGRALVNALATLARDATATACGCSPTTTTLQQLRHTALQVAPSATPHDCSRGSSVTKIEMGDLAARDLQLCAGMISAGTNPVAALA